MKKLFLAIIWGGCLNLALFLLQACQDPCNPKPVNFKLASIEGIAKKIQAVEPQGSSQILYYKVQDMGQNTQGLRYDSIGLDISNQLEIIASSNKGQFIGQAIACSPMDKYETLSDIVIRSSQAYGAYPQGEDLKDVMQIRSGYQYQGEDIRAFLADGLVQHSNFFLTFKNPPAAEETHEFTIEFKLVDGRIVKTTIPGVSIKN